MVGDGSGACASTLTAMQHARSGAATAVKRLDGAVGDANGIDCQEGLATNGVRTIRPSPAPPSSATPVRSPIAAVLSTVRSSRKSMMKPLSRIQLGTRVLPRGCALRSADPGARRAMSRKLGNRFVRRASHSRDNDDGTGGSCHPTKVGIDDQSTHRCQGMLVVREGAIITLGETASQGAGSSCARPSRCRLPEHPSPHGVAWSHSCA